MVRWDTRVQCFCQNTKYWIKYKHVVLWDPPVAPGTPCLPLGAAVDPGSFHCWAERRCSPGHRHAWQLALYDIIHYLYSLFFTKQLKHRIYSDFVPLWISVHHISLSTVPVWCPDVYSEPVVQAGVYFCLVNWVKKQHRAFVLTFDKAAVNSGGKTWGMKPITISWFFDRSFEAVV